MYLSISCFFALRNGVMLGNYAKTQGRFCGSNIIDYRGLEPDPHPLPRGAVPDAARSADPP